MEGLIQTHSHILLILYDPKDYYNDRQRALFEKAFLRVDFSSAEERGKLLNFYVHGSILSSELQKKAEEVAQKYPLDFCALYDPSYSNYRSALFEKAFLAVGSPSPKEAKNMFDLYLKRGSPSPELQRKIEEMVSRYALILIDLYDEDQTYNEQKQIIFEDIFGRFVSLNDPRYMRSFIEFYSKKRMNSEKLNGTARYIAQYYPDYLLEYYDMIREESDSPQKFHLEKAFLSDIFLLKNFSFSNEREKFFDFYINGYYTSSEFQKKAEEVLQQYPDEICQLYSSKNQYDHRQHGIFERAFLILPFSSRGEGYMLFNFYLNEDASSESLEKKVKEIAQKWPADFISLYDPKKEYTKNKYDLFFASLLEINHPNEKEVSIFFHLYLQQSSQKTEGQEECLVLIREYPILAATIFSESEDKEIQKALLEGLTEKKNYSAEEVKIFFTFLANLSLEMTPRVGAKCALLFLQYPEEGAEYLPVSIIITLSSEQLSELPEKIFWNTIENFYHIYPEHAILSMALFFQKSGRTTLLPREKELLISIISLIPTKELNNTILSMLPNIPDDYPTFPLWKSAFEEVATKHPSVMFDRLPLVGKKERREHYGNLAFENASPEVLIQYYPSYIDYLPDTQSRLAARLGEINEQEAGDLLLKVSRIPEDQKERAVEVIRMLIPKMTAGDILAHIGPIIYFLREEGKRRVADAAHENPNVAFLQLNPQKKNERSILIELGTSIGESMNEVQSEYFFRILDNTVYKNSLEYSEYAYAEDKNTDFVADILFMNSTLKLLAQKYPKLAFRHYPLCVLILGKEEADEILKEGMSGAGSVARSLHVFREAYGEEDVSGQYAKINFQELFSQMIAQGDVESILTDFPGDWSPIIESQLTAVLMQKNFDLCIQHKDKLPSYLEKEIEQEQNMRGIERFLLENHVDQKEMSPFFQQVQRVQIRAAAEDIRNSFYSKSIPEQSIQPGGNVLSALQKGGLQNPSAFYQDYLMTSAKRAGINIARVSPGDTVQIDHGIFILRRKSGKEERCLLSLGKIDYKGALERQKKATILKRNIIPQTPQEQMYVANFYYEYARSHPNKALSSKNISYFLSLSDPDASFRAIEGLEHIAKTGKTTEMLNLLHVIGDFPVADVNNWESIIILSQRKRILNVALHNNPIMLFRTLSHVKVKKKWENNGLKNLWEYYRDASWAAMIQVIPESAVSTAAGNSGSDERLSFVSYIHFSWIENHDTGLSQKYNPAKNPELNTKNNLQFRRIRISRYLTERGIKIINKKVVQEAEKNIFEYRERSHNIYAYKGRTVIGYTKDNVIQMDEIQYVVEKQQSGEGKFLGFKTPGGFSSQMSQNIINADGPLTFLHLGHALNINQLADALIERWKRIGKKEGEVRDTERDIIITGGCTAMKNSTQLLFQKIQEAGFPAPHVIHQTEVGKFGYMDNKRMGTPGLFGSPFARSVLFGFDRNNPDAMNDPTTLGNMFERKEKAYEEKMIRNNSVFFLIGDDGKPVQISSNDEILDQEERMA